jgi:hypothetical protein
MARYASRSDPRQDDSRDASGGSDSNTGGTGETGNYGKHIEDTDTSVGGSAKSRWWSWSGLGQFQFQGLPLPERSMVWQDERRFVYVGSGSESGGQPRGGRQGMRRLIQSKRCPKTPGEKTGRFYFQVKQNDCDR